VTDKSEPSRQDSVDNRAGARRGESKEKRLNVKKAKKVQKHENREWLFWKTFALAYGAHTRGHHEESGLE